MRKQVMSLAWALFKSTKTNFTSFADALRSAWYAIKAKAAIYGLGAQVTFRKADNTVTTRMAFPFQGEVKGTGRSNPLTVLYHDPINNKTGCFRADRLLNWTPVIAHV